MPRRFYGPKECGICNNLDFIVFVFFNNILVYSKNEVDQMSHLIVYYNS